MTGTVHTEPTMGSKETSNPAPYSPRPGSKPHGSKELIMKKKTEAKRPTSLPSFSLRKKFARLQAQAVGSPSSKRKQLLLKQVEFSPRAERSLDQLLSPGDPISPTPSISPTFPKSPTVPISPTETLPRALPVEAVVDDLDPQSTGSRKDPQSSPRASAYEDVPQRNYVNLDQSTGSDEDPGQSATNGKDPDQSAVNGEDIGQSSEISHSMVSSSDGDMEKDREHDPDVEGESHAEGDENNNESLPFECSSWKSFPDPTTTTITPRFHLYEPINDDEDEEEEEEDQRQQKGSTKWHMHKPILIKIEESYDEDEDDDDELGGTHHTGRPRRVSETVNDVTCDALTLILRCALDNYTRYRFLSQVDKYPSQKLFSKYYTSRPYLLSYTRWLASEGIYRSSSISCKQKSNFLSNRRNSTFPGTPRRSSLVPSQSGSRRGSLITDVTKFLAANSGLGSNTSKSNSATNNKDSGLARDSNDTENDSARKIEDIKRVENSKKNSSKKNVFSLFMCCASKQSKDIDMVNEECAPQPYYAL